MTSRAVRPCSDFADSAALTGDFARLALADSRIAAYETKYFYTTWRPRTAIPAGNGA